MSLENQHVERLQTLSPMAMGNRQRNEQQTSMWVAIQDLPRSAAHPFHASERPRRTSNQMVANPRLNRRSYTVEL
jgi:hypothetical protein